MRDVVLPLPDHATLAMSVVGREGVLALVAEVATQTAVEGAVAVEITTTTAIATHSTLLPAHLTLAMIMDLSTIPMALVLATTKDLLLPLAMGAAAMEAAILLMVALRPHLHLTHSLRVVTEEMVDTIRTLKATLRMIVSHGVAKVRFKMLLETFLKQTSRRRRNNNP